MLKFDPLLIGNLAEVAIALNLAYLGLDRFQYRKTVLRHVGDAEAEVGAASPVPGATDEDRGEFRAVQKGALKRFGMIEDGEEAWQNSNWKNIYINIYRSGLDRYLVLLASIYALLMIFWGTFSDLPPGASDNGFNLVSPYVLLCSWGALSQLVLVPYLLLAVFWCWRGRWGWVYSRSGVTIILFFSLLISIYLMYYWYPTRTFAWYAAISVFLSCLLPSIFWAGGRFVEKAAVRTVNQILKDSALRLQNMADAQIQSELADIQSDEYRRALRNGAYRSSSQDVAGSP